MRQPRSRKAGHAFHVRSAKGLKELTSHKARWKSANAPMTREANRVARIRRMTSLRSTGRRFSLCLSDHHKPRTVWIERRRTSAETAANKKIMLRRLEEATWPFSKH